MNQDAKDSPSDAWDLLHADLVRTARENRWGTALGLIGWIHLSYFLGLQALVSSGDSTRWHYPAAWAAEVVTILAAVHAISGPVWWRPGPLAGVIVRVWATFLILAFGAATLQNLSGWEHDWFKPTWCSLATFGYAVMAWLLDLRFLILAAQMYGTGSLMVLYPDWNYLICGLSWWAALQAIGWKLRRDAGLGRETEEETGAVLTGSAGR